jgi:hypothetical protein
MPIAFPSFICGIILSQYPSILVSTNVTSKRESPFSMYFKLFAGTHVSDIVVTSGKEAASSTSKEGIIGELKFVSMSLEETIKSSTERKTSVDKLIMALTNQKEDVDLAEVNEDAAGNEDEDVVGNGNDDHHDESEDET